MAGPARTRATLGLNGKKSSPSPPAVGGEGRGEEEHFFGSPSLRLSPHSFLAERESRTSAIVVVLLLRAFRLAESLRLDVSILNSFKKSRALETSHIEANEFRALERGL